MLIRSQNERMLMEMTGRWYPWSSTKKRMKRKRIPEEIPCGRVGRKEIQEEIDDLRMNKMFPALLQDGMPHGSSCMDLSEYAAQLDELLTELKDQMEQRIRIRREITQRIEAMQDETEKQF